jgi:hypothetical protein
VTDVPHAFSVDPDQIISGQDPAVSSEGSSGRNGSNDKSVGSVVFDVDLIGKVKVVLDVALIIDKSFQTKVKIIIGIA